MQSKIFSYFQRGGAASSGAAGAVEGARGTSAGEGGQSATQPTWALPKPVIDSSGNRAPAGASAPASDGPLAGFSPRFLSPPASPSWLLDLPRDFDVDALVATLRSPGAAPWQDSSHAGSGAGRGWSDIPDPSSGAGRGGPEPPTERTRRMSAHRRAVARHWAAVRLALDEPIASYRDLSRCIVRCAESSHVLDGDMGGRSRRGFRPPALDGLEQMLRDCFTEEERVALFGGGALPAMGPAAADQGASSAWWAPMAARGGGDGALGSVALPAGGGLLSSLCRLARRLPSAGLYDRVPLLVQDEACEARVTQWQCAVVLANALFCAWPRRRGKRMRRSEASSPRLPDINFAGMYRGRSSPRPDTAGKLRCLFGYFARVVSALDPAHQGTLVCVERREHPLSSLSAFPEGTIEGEQGATHADFANRWIGGGVLRKGCVQEEIRFAIAPECLLSLCLCEVMDDAEAVVITGPERYAQSTGYASSFCYAGHYNDNAGTLRVAGGSGGETDSLTRDIEVAAMDALKFRGSSVSTQYEAPAMRRECTKALAAMVPTSIRVAAARGGPAGGHPFASGNWGCGVFGGHHELKSLLQWVAASVAGRQLHLYTFGLEDLAKQLNAVEAAVAREADVGRRATAGALWCALRAAGDRVRVDAPSPGDGLAGAVERAVSSADSARAALKALEGRPLSPREVILFAGAYVVVHAKA